MMRALCLVAFATVLGFAALPAWAGAPFVTEDPETLDPGAYEVDFSLSATHVKGETSGAAPGFEIDYGAVVDLEVHLFAALAYDRTTGARQFGYGDTELGVKYRF